MLDGFRFDSAKEARRYQELKLLERAGEVRNLTVQPRFPLSVSTDGAAAPQQIGVYRADFAYDTSAGSVVEDVKSPPTKTPLWRWKVKHLRAQYGIEVRVEM